MDALKGYKKTKIGELPEEWEVKPYTAFAEYLNGYPFSPSQWKREGRPIIRIQNLNGSEEFNCYDREVGDRYSVRYGDLLFSWSGTVDVFIWGGPDALLNQHIFKVVPKEGVMKKYLYYSIKYFLLKISSRVHGSTMKHFKKGELNVNYLPLPPLPEQKKIAEILSTVDLAIQKSNEIIENTERLKRGAMQKLLTRGIGHTKFRKTDVGLLPEDWEVKRVKEIIDEVTRYANKVKKNEYGQTGEIPVVDQGSELVAGFTDEPPQLEDLPVIVFGDHTGIIKYVDFAFVMGADGTKVLKPMRGIHTKYLYYALKNSAFKTEGYRRHMAILRDIKVFIPKDILEQKKIAEILSTLDEKLQKEHGRKQNLERVKKALMNDLLTGKKRVMVNSNG